MRARRAAIGLASAAAVMAVTVLAGCTGASGSSDAGGMADAASAQAAEVAATAGADSQAPAGLGAESDSEAGTAAGAESQNSGGEAAPSQGRPGTDGTSDAPLIDGRQIIRTATVSVQVTVPRQESDARGDAPSADRADERALASAAAQAATKVRALAPGNGGYVSASDSGADGGGATIAIVLRIPATSYASVMHSLDGIGQITSRTEKTSDVTDQMVDVASRISTMKASIDRIRTLLAQAEDIGDVISIESELASREADLESLQHRRAALADQVALSTISVTVTAVLEGTESVAQRQEDGFLAGLAGGWRALTAFGTWLGTVAGALLPFLPLIAAVMLAVVWWGRRRRVTSGRGARLPSPPAPAAGPVSPAAGPVSPSAGAGDLP